MTIITRNRNAKRYYNIEETYEAGIQLTGSEVKSIRAGRVQLKDAFAGFRDDELWLFNAHIAPYKQATHENHEPERPRKLLMHRSQLESLKGKLTRKGYSLVPTRVFLKGSWIKVKLGLGKGKKRADRRRDLKEKQHQREIDKVIADRQKDMYDY